MWQSCSTEVDQAVVVNICLFRQTEAYTGRVSVCIFFILLKYALVKSGLFIKHMIYCFIYCNGFFVDAGQTLKKEFTFFPVAPSLVPPPYASDWLLLSSVAFLSYCIALVPLRRARPPHC